MRKVTIRLSILVVAVLLFATACEQERILFDSSGAVVGFSSSSLTITEDGAGGTIKVYLGASSGTAPTTVSIGIETAGLSNPAMETTDFTLSSKEISTAVGESSFTITPVDNDVFSGDKKVVLRILSNSAGYDITAEDSIVITISDNEHPLKAWIGTYDVDANSYGDELYGYPPGDWDEAWVVTTSPVPGKLDQISMLGIGGGNVAITATLDATAGTITIEADQNVGNCYGWGPVHVHKGGADMVIVPDTPLTGTISPDGTIMVDNWLHEQPTQGWNWDEFNTTWTKR